MQMMKQMTRAKLLPDNIHYKIGSNIYTRVSEVLRLKPRPEIELWKKRLGEKEAARVAQETADIGTRIHVVTMHWDRGNWATADQCIQQDTWLTPHVLAWNEWAGKSVKKWLVIEGIVYSDQWMLAGQIDRVAIITGDRRPSIVDIKSGSLHSGIALQLALYKLMYNKLYTPKVDRVIAVNLPRDEPGVLRVKEYTSKEAEKEAVELVKEYNKMFRG